jgi:hypothetical protein
LEPVNTISSGTGREPNRWRRGWPPGNGWDWGRAWLVVLVAAAVAVTVVDLVTARGHARRVVSAPLPSALGFWTGAGPLRTFAPAQGSPMALSAPGTG